MKAKWSKEAEEFYEALHGESFTKILWIYIPAVILPPDW